MEGSSAGKIIGVYMLELFDKITESYKKIIDIQKDTIDKATASMSIFENLMKKLVSRAAENKDETAYISKEELLNICNEIGLIWKNADNKSL